VHAPIRLLGLASIAGLTLGCDAPPPPPSASLASATAVSSAAASGAPPAATTTATASATASAAPTAAPVGPKVAEGERPCEKAPPGMVCIPGGPAVIGSDTDKPAERPRHTVTISTFYLDAREVTNADYEACEQAGFCKKRGIVPKFVPFLRPELPAVPISYLRARQYCQWAGKRLPTEAEWEKAARGGDGRKYPWGDEPPTCERAQIQGCEPNMTKPGGSFPPNPYGLYDMAGNGYEWVLDWASACYGKPGKPGEPAPSFVCWGGCGDECMGRDPAGPCGGAPACEKHDRRVLKGGSWHWDGDHARTSSRRGVLPEEDHRLSVRCASSEPWLATWPPKILSEPGPEPKAPSPPTKEQLAIFHDVVADTDVAKLPTCEEERGSTDCRSPFSHVVTNEPHFAAFEPYVKNLGGAVVAVGSDQGYSLAAAARAEWLWLLDYDPIVVALHSVLRVVIEASADRDAFVRAFSDAGAADTKKLLERALSDKEKKAALQVWGSARGALAKVYASERAEPRGLGWLRSEPTYQHMRALVTQGRVHSVPGNLLTDKVMPAIGRAADKLGVVVRIYYPSNADDLWALTPRYRQNVLGLPMDARSVVVRTIERRDRPKPPEDPWIYLVQGAPQEREKLRRGYTRVVDFLEDTFPTEVPHFRVGGLEGKAMTPSAPPSPAAKGAKATGKGPAGE
jgi:sulfatase modifying factor 1